MEIALGREQLFFRTDNVPKLKGRLSDTMDFSMVSQIDADREKITQVIDLDTKEQFEMFNTDIFKDQIEKSNKVFILGDLSYYDAKDLLETLC